MREAKQQTEESEMSDKIEVSVSKQVLIEVVDGGLFFVSLLNGGKQTSRTAATSSAALFKQLTTLLALQKQKRGPRKDKTPKAAE
jgi:hypothetical protein